MQTQIIYINTRLVYTRYLFKYLSYVAHTVPRAMACWIVCCFARVTTRGLHVSRVRIMRITAYCLRAKSRVSARRRTLFARYRTARMLPRAVHFAAYRSHVSRVSPRVAHAYLVCRSRGSRDVCA